MASYLIIMQAKFHGFSSFGFWDPKEGLESDPLAVRWVQMTRYCYFRVPEESFVVIDVFVSSLKSEKSLFFL